MKLIACAAALLAAQCLAAPAQTQPADLAPWAHKADALVAQGPYKADWQSLKAHKDPEWFRDAKLGIYTHWGPVTVGSSDSPGDAEWYGKQMYDPGHAAFKFHQQRFGDQNKVGYKDIIPLFTAEKFDANEWADLFAKSGARFAGPVAVHHDQFAMWDAQTTRWNAKAMGPHRDVVGELEKAIRARGMRYFTSFHHGFAWKYYEPAFKFDAADPKLADLYGDPHAPGAPPTQRFLTQWLAMVNEVVEKYQPDLIWFDFELGTVIPAPWQQRMFATVYNQAAAQKREISIAHKHREIQQHTGLLDFERGREDKLTPYPWLTDTATGPWFYVKEYPTRPVNDVIDVFVDIVSKNGCMLLNVGPKVDGTIPDQARDVLLGLGKWLAVNGEAIYETRPWAIFGEGPTRGGGGAFSEERSRREFGAADIRFTTKGDKLYAITLDWPKDGIVRIRSLAADAGKIDKITLLGGKADLAFKQTAEALEVALPAEKPCDYAWALRIEGQSLKPVSTASAAPIVKPAADGAVTLLPAAAALHGQQVRVEERNGHAYIAAWDHADEWVSWKIELPAPGTYSVTVTYSSAYADSPLALDVAGNKLSVAAKKTPGWFEYGTLELGPVTIDKPAFELSIRPGDPAAWKAVNIRQVILRPIKK